MKTEEVLQALKEMGTEQTRKTFLRHGAPESTWGVKIGDMKTLVKKIKKDHELSLSLYRSGYPDAMYFAGLIADEKKISSEELQEWAETSSWSMISEYTVPWICAESPYGWELGNKWVNSNDTKIAATGWATLTSVISLIPNEKLDIASIRKLIQKTATLIKTSSGRMVYAMNMFLISAAIYIPELKDELILMAEKLGPMEVDMGDTACKVPYLPEYVKRAEERGALGKKKKQARC